MAKKIRPASGLAPAQRWDQTHASYLTGRAHIDGAEALGIAAEAYWGCGRLRILVDANLRSRFDSQRSKLQVAIETAQSVADVIWEADRMAQAWRVLDKAARDAGHPPISSTVWEVALKDGTVAAIVQDNTIAKDVVANGRAVVVYTLDEIAELLSHYAGVVKAKQVFPGATVTRVRKTISDPLSDFAAPEAQAQAAEENAASAAPAEDEVPW